MKKTLLILFTLLNSISYANTEAEEKCEAPVGISVKKFIIENTLANVASVNKDGTLKLSDSWQQFSKEDIQLAQEDLDNFNDKIRAGEIDKFKTNDVRLQKKGSKAALCLCVNCPCNGGLGGGGCCNKVVLWFFCLSQGNC